MKEKENFSDPILNFDYIDKNNYEINTEQRNKKLSSLIKNIDNKYEWNDDSDSDSEFEKIEEDYFKLKLDRSVKVNNIINKIKKTTRTKKQRINRIDISDIDKIKLIHKTYELCIYPEVSFENCCKINEFENKSSHIDNEDKGPKKVRISNNEYYLEEIPEIGTNLFFKYLINENKQHELMYIGKNEMYFNARKIKKYIKPNANISVKSDILNNTIFYNNANSFSKSSKDIINEQCSNQEICGNSIINSKNNFLTSVNINSSKAKKTNTKRKQISQYDINKVNIQHDKNYSLLSNVDNVDNVDNIDNKYNIYNTYSMSINEEKYILVSNKIINRKIQII